MPKPRSQTGEKNLISKNLIELRKKNHFSQRMLAYHLQLIGVTYGELIDGQKS